MGKKGSRRRTTGLRGRRGTRQRLKLVSPLKNGRRDLGERANNRRRMRHLKGRDIGAMVDGERVAVVSGESEKSRVVPLRDISLGGVKIPIDFIPDAQKGGKDENRRTDERRRRRGGGRSGRRRGGGKEDRKWRLDIFRRIHIFFFFDVTLAGRESQRPVDDNGENDRADDANGRALCVDGDRRERSGGERDDGDDDGCLSDWLRFYISKANFMSGASGEGGEDRRGSKERACESARARGRNQGQKRRPKLGRRILHGSSVWAKT
jgi:hypothetical protein